MEYVTRAKDLLEEANKMCTSSSHNAAGLRTAVDQTLRLLRKEWYEPVSAEDIAAIKAAMNNGSQGIATHSGRWYECQNGHPFAAEECGMPMEEARCLECGARVGGGYRVAVAGIRRAVEME